MGKLDIAKWKLSGEEYKELEAEQLEGLVATLIENTQKRFDAATNVQNQLGQIDLRLYTAYVDVSVAAMNAKGLIQADLDEGMTSLEINDLGELWRDVRDYRGWRYVCVIFNCASSPGDYQAIEPVC